MEKAKRPGRLQLNRETVRELSEQELETVAGATVRNCTGYYPSLNAPCVSIRVPCVGLSQAVC
jgi:hypothetical protein